MTTAPGTVTGAVTLDGSSIAVESGAANVRLSCSGTATCVGKVTLTVKHKPVRGKKAKTETIGTASFSILAGNTKLIKVKLNGSGRALLRSAHGRLDATIDIAKSSPSPGKTETQSVHLKQKAAHKK